MSQSYYLFTPVDTATGRRLRLALSHEDRIRVGSRGKERSAAIVWDAYTGMHWMITPRACSLPDCWCDASATKLEREGAVESLSPAPS